MGQTAQTFLIQYYSLQFKKVKLFNINSKTPALGTEFLNVSVCFTQKLTFFWVLTFSQNAKLEYAIA